MSVDDPHPVFGSEIARSVTRHEMPRFDDLPCLGGSPIALTANGEHTLAIDTMSILWWHWLIVGLALLVIEVLNIGGFYTVFFGIGALVVGVLSAIGIGGPMWLQWLLFSIISVGGLVLFREKLLKIVQHKRGPDVDSLVGQIGVVVEDIAPGAVGKVELRGTGWSAKTIHGVVAYRGLRVRVTRVEGLLLFVEPEGAN